MPKLSKSRLQKIVPLLGMLIFGLTSYGFMSADVRHDTLLVFGLAPAVFCAFAALGWMRLRTILTTEFVLVVVWLWARFGLFDPRFFWVYYVVIAVTLVAIKLFDLCVNMWKHIKSGATAPASQAVKGDNASSSGSGAQG